MLRLAVLSLALAAPAAAQLHVLPVEDVVIHPPLAVPFQCAEHPMGAEDHAVDALGTDCTVPRSEGDAFPALYAGDGLRNEDWYAWRESVLAPFDGVVVLAAANETVNTPGTWGQGRAAAVAVRRLAEDDGRPVHVVLVHLREITVAEGDTVRAGQPVGRVGNNGISRFPHLHVGAFRGEVQDVFSGSATALQLRFDLEAMGRLRGTLTDEAPDE